MARPEKVKDKQKRSETDRRKANRFDTTILVNIRFMSDGTPIQGQVVEIGPNGMRLVTGIPMSEASYVHVTFLSASNNTFCEGRVVWCQPTEQENQYESGVDIQRWGGDMPGDSPIEKVPFLRSKKDRRKR